MSDSMTNTFAAHVNDVSVPNKQEVVEYIDFVRLSAEQLDDFLKEDFQKRISMLGQAQIKTLDNVKEVGGKMVSTIFCGNGIVSENKAQKLVADDLGVNPSEIKGLQIKAGSPDDKGRERVRRKGSTFLAIKVNSGYITFEKPSRQFALVNWRSGDDPQLAVFDKKEDIMQSIFTQSRNFGAILKSASSVKMAESIDVRLKVPPMGETHFYYTDDEEADIDLEEADDVDPFQKELSDTNVLLSDDELAKMSICLRDAPEHESKGEFVTSVGNIKHANIAMKGGDHIVSNKEESASVTKLEPLF